MYTISPKILTEPLFFDRTQRKQIFLLFFRYYKNVNRNKMYTMFIQITTLTGVQHISTTLYYAEIFFNEKLNTDVFLCQK